MTASAKPPRRRKPAKPRSPGASIPAVEGTPAATAPVASTTATTAASPEAGQLLMSVPVELRWRDLDAFNHVNNSSYLTFLEEARLRWLSSIDGPWFGEDSMPVLASVNINYRRPLAWPAKIRVELTALRVGQSSLTIGHRIVDAGDDSALYSDGHVVVVWMNPLNGRSVSLPAAIRDTCAR